MLLYFFFKSWSINYPMLCWFRDYIKFIPFLIALVCSPIFCSLIAEEEAPKIKGEEEAPKIKGEEEAPQIVGEEALKEKEEEAFPKISEKEAPKLSLSDAIAYTLDHQLQIKISELNVKAQRGVVRNAAGPFDPVIDGDISYTGIKHVQCPVLNIRTSKDGHETTAFLGASKKARLGTVVSVSAQVDQVDDFCFFPKPTNIGTITFRIEQPLLRNFMLSQDTVNEQAARFELSAVYYDNLQTVSQQILNTTTQYWEVVSLQKQLEISKQAEERYIKLTDEIQQLIKEDQLARTDIEQPIAQIERQRLINIQLAQALYSEIQTLKLTMGDVNLCGKDADQLLAIDNIPKVDLDVKKFQEVANELIHYATSYRYDIRASFFRQLAFEALLEGAYNQVLPEVNLRGAVNSTDFRRKGSAEPLLKPLKLKNPQTSFTIGLHISVPLYNDAAEGTLMQRQAQKSQSVLSTQLIVQTTIRDLRQAIADQINLTAELIKANSLVEINRTLIANERKKLLEGFSTLFVLLDFENRLTQSLSDQVDISKQFIQNVALIRFLTGTLLMNEGPASCIEVADVTLLPELNNGESNGSS